MSKVTRGTLVGLAVAAIAAPLAQAESKGASDVYRAGDVSRLSDVSRPNPMKSGAIPNPMKSAAMPNPLKMGIAPNPMKWSARLNPWKVGSLQRMLPWGSRGIATY
jgi:hypothetical protein